MRQQPLCGIDAVELAAQGDARSLIAFPSRPHEGVQANSQHRRNGEKQCRGSEECCGDPVPPQTFIAAKNDPIVVGRSTLNTWADANAPTPRRPQRGGQCPASPR